jgi:hypothetical protein
MKKANNWGSCKGPHCLYNAPLCAWNMCRRCCETIHIDGKGKALEHKRPMIAGREVGFKVNDRSKKVEDDKPQEPTFGKLEKTEEPEWPLEIDRIW